MSTDTAEREAALRSQIATALVGAIPISLFAALAVYAFALTQPVTVAGITPTAPGVTPVVYAIAAFVTTLFWATWMADAAHGGYE